MASCPKEQKIVRSVIEMYRNMPYLWRRDHEDYLHKDIREEGFKVLLGIYHQFDENATMKMIKKKIENMRTTYQKEWKKVLASQMAGDDPVYVPSLWYYSMLNSFLNDGNEPWPEAETEKIKSENGTDEVETRRRRRRKGNRAQIQRRALNGVTSESARKIFTTIRRQIDPIDSYGKAIGYELKDLHGPQLVICKKIISDAIFYAKLHKLNENSQILNPVNEVSHVEVYEETDE